MALRSSVAGKKQEPVRDEKGKFVPGVSGNPAGRPHGTILLKNIIKKQLAELDPKTKKPKAEEVISNAIRFANEGSAVHLKILVDANDGLQAETKKIELTLKNGVKKAPEDMTDEELDEILNE